ncbi:MAG: aspartate--ammonia ligase [Planctomycetota bacterium]
MLRLPKQYEPTMDIRRRERAIKDIKDFFEKQLADALGLYRVTAPLFVRGGSGINDDLNGVEEPVRFSVKENGNAPMEIVQSLAKWKRLALKEYEFEVGEGLYTDMNAIRPDETIDELHSIYVDQWDWEKIIAPEQRDLRTLRNAVEAIYDCICRTEFHVASQYSSIRPVLPEQITFVTAEELRSRWPESRPKERENKICAQHGAVFVIGIGGDLADGKPHDGRAPDYDDWITPNSAGGNGLNGDILLWNPVLKRTFELSSMGIRVSPKTLREQLKVREQEERITLDFHRKLLGGELPQTMGGGIGQSRLCMFCLRCAHVGEVACGVWPDEDRDACKQLNITLL